MCYEVLHALCCWVAINRPAAGPKDGVSGGPGDQLFFSRAARELLASLSPEVTCLRTHLWIFKPKESIPLQMMMFYRKPFPWREFLHPLFTDPSACNRPYYSAARQMHWAATVNLHAL